MAPSDPAVPAPAANRPRWQSFAHSLSLHFLAVCGLLWRNSQPHSQEISLKDFKVELLPKHELPDIRVVQRDLRRMTPDIVPARTFGRSKTPKGQLDPSQTLVARSKRPNSSKQFILRPKKPKPILADTPAPNLVAVQPTAGPPVKLQPKSLVLPSPQVKPKTEAPAMAETAPLIETRELAKQTALALPKLPLWRVVAPPSRASKKGDAQPLPEPPSLADEGSASPGLQAVVVSLNPAIGKIPEGSRPAQFAVAPTKGRAASGSNDREGAVVVPGLAARGGSAGTSSVPATPPTPSKVSQGRLVKEFVPPSINRTMSAPLRPSSRVIPAIVESKFSNRDVYTLVIPGPELPGYAGDWVLWFSELTPVEGIRQRISSPVPARKYTVQGETTASDSAGKGSIQISAAINRQGHVSSPRVMRGGATSEAFRQRAIEELRTWEFQPALRNGEPIEVDIVLEIPFQFQTVH